jgi:hypothetical protein
MRSVVIDDAVWYGHTPPLLAGTEDAFMVPSYTLNLNTRPCLVEVKS